MALILNRWTRLSGKLRTILQSHEGTVNLVPFFLMGLLVVSWFRRGYFIYVWDTTYPVNAAAYLANFSNVWRGLYAPGFSDANGLPFVPYFAVVYFLQDIIGLPIVVAEGVLFYLLFVMSGISLYKFAHEFLQDVLGGRALRGVSVLSGVFYTVNLYTLYYIWRIFTVEAFLLAFFPLVAYETWKGLEKARVRSQIDIFGAARIVLLGFLILPAFTNPAFLLVAIAFLGSLVAYGFWHTPRTKKSIFKQGIFAILGLAFWALSNLWWILPQVTNSGVVIARVGIDWLDVQSNSIHTTFQNVIRLQGMPPLYQQSPATIVYSFASLYQNDPFFVAISVLIPVVCFASLSRVSPVGRRAVFLGLVAVPFIFATEGLNPPLGAIFGWFYEHFSFMVAFRDPYQKVGWMILLTYSILFPLGLLRVYKFVRLSVSPNHIRLNRSLRSLVPAVLILLVIGVYCWPFFTGDIILPGANVSIPSYYDSAKTFLDSKAGVFRLLSLPLDQVLQGSIWDHGYVGNDLLRATTGREVISTLTPDRNVTDLLSNAMTLMHDNNTYVAKILGVLNVRYVMIRNDANLNFSLSRTPPTILASEIANQTGMSRVALFGSLELYENNQFGPRIYAVTNVTSSGSLTNPGIVGWTSEDYAGTWHTSNPNAVLAPSNPGLSFSFTPDASNQYAYFDNDKALNVSVGTFPYMLATFHTSSQARLSFNVVSQSGASFFLYASNPPPTNSGTAYGSSESYRLVFPLENYFKPSDAIAKIYVNLTPASQGQTQTLNLTLTDLRLVSYVGSTMDTARLMASPSFNWTSTAIAGTPFSNVLKGSPPKIGFQELGPSEYQVRITNATSPFLLVFAATYDNNWQLFLGSSHHSTPLAASHLRIDGYANGWVVDNLGTFTLTISHGLQNYAEFGFYVSIATLGSLALILFIASFHQRFRSSLPRRLASIVRFRKAHRSCSVYNLATTSSIANGCLRGIHQLVEADLAQ